MLAFTQKLAGTKRPADTTTDNVPTKVTKVDPTTTTVHAAPPPYFAPSGVDDVTEQVMDLIAKGCVEDAEIEASLGSVVDRYVGNRIKPRWVKSAFIIDDENAIFDSRVTEPAFIAVNQAMNKLIKEEQQTRNASYTKSSTIDIFAKDADQQVPNGVERRVLRHTYDTAKKKVTTSVEKLKARSIDVYSPAYNVDLRFRAGVERGVAIPNDVTSEALLSTASKFRRKERRSYHLDCFTVEMTTVTEYTPPKDAPFRSLAALDKAPGVQKFEIELELDIKVFNTARAAAAGDDASKATFRDYCEYVIIWIFFFFAADFFAVLLETELD